MALLKQVQLARVRKCQGMVGERRQLAAFCILERARALDPIDRQKATVVLEPLARPGANDPGAERGHWKRHAGICPVRWRERHADLRGPKTVDPSVVADVITVQEYSHGIIVVMRKQNGP